MIFYNFVVPVFLFLVSFMSVYEIQSISSQQIADDNLLDEPVSVKITSHSDGDKVSVGELTISGISSDDSEKNCIVYVDWNNKKPFQQVRAAGAGGINDFSEWFFTYDKNYYIISEGNNDLTSKITCINSTGPPGTKWYSVNLLGVTDTNLADFNQDNNLSNSIKEPSQKVLPGYSTSFENPDQQNDLEDQTRNLIKEPSQKVLPGYSTSFENPDQQNDLEDQTRNLINESSQSIDLSNGNILNKNKEKTNFIAESNPSVINPDPINMQNNTGDVKNIGNDSEVHIIETNNTQPFPFENNIQSKNTQPNIDSTKNHSNPDKITDSISSEDVSILITLPEPVILNTNYSSELSVLINDSLPLVNAIISGKISNIENPNYVKNLLGKTDSNGIYKFPLKVSNQFPTGKYNLMVIVTKLGLPDNTFFTDFFVSDNMTLTEDLKDSIVGNFTNTDEVINKTNIFNNFSQSTNTYFSNDDQMESSTNSAIISTPPFKLNEHSTIKNQEQPLTLESNKSEGNSNLNFPIFKLHSFFP